MVYFYLEARKQSEILRGELRARSTEKDRILPLLS